MEARANTLSYIGWILYPRHNYLNFISMCIYDWNPFSIEKHFIRLSYRKSFRFIIVKYFFVWCMPMRSSFWGQRQPSYRHTVPGTFELLLLILKSSLSLLWLQPITMYRLLSVLWWYFFFQFFLFFCVSVWVLCRTILHTAKNIGYVEYSLGVWLDSSCEMNKRQLPNEANFRLNCVVGTTKSANLDKIFCRMHAYTHTHTYNASTICK